MFVSGIILSRNSCPTISSIGTGLISSSIVSIAVWLFQFLENINQQIKIKRNLYNLIKREFIIKLSLAQLFLFNDNRTLCQYLFDLSEQASKCHKEKQGEEHLMLYLQRFINSETFSNYTYQILGLLDSAINNNLISIEAFNRLNAMFQFEISIIKLLNEGNQNDAIGLFSSFLVDMLNAIKYDKNLKTFRHITIKNDKFCLESKKTSKEDKGLFSTFINNNQPNKI